MTETVRDDKAPGKEARSPRSPGRPQVISRQKVVDAALAMLEEKDQKNLSIRSLARHLGTGKATLYNYFDSMDAIRNAVMERLLEQLPALDPDKPEPMRKQLVDMLMALYDLSEDRYAVVAQAAMTPGNQAALRVFNNSLEALSAAGVELERAAISLRMLRDFVVASSPSHWGVVGGVRPLTDEDLDLWGPDEGLALKTLAKSPLLNRPFRDTVQMALELAIDRMLPELAG